MRVLSERLWFPAYVTATSFASLKTHGPVCLFFRTFPSAECWCWDKYLQCESGFKSSPWAVMLFAFSDMLWLDLLSFEFWRSSEIHNRNCLPRPFGCLAYVGTSLFLCLGMTEGKKSQKIVPWMQSKSLSWDRCFLNDLLCNTLQREEDADWEPSIYQSWVMSDGF